MTNGVGSGQGDVVALFQDARRGSPLRVDQNAPVSATLASSNIATVQPAALELVAIQFMSGPIAPPSADPANPVPTAPALPYWPAMLTRAQLCQYLGVSWSTLKGVLTVRPVDLGASVVRYSRAQIDDWIATRPPRVKGGHQPLLEVVTDGSVQDERLTSLERVRRRAGRC